MNITGRTLKEAINLRRKKVTLKFKVFHFNQNI